MKKLMCAMIGLGFLMSTGILFAADTPKAVDETKQEEKKTRKDKKKKKKVVTEEKKAA